MGDKMGLGRGKHWIYPSKMKQNKETGDAFSGLTTHLSGWTCLSKNGVPSADFSYSLLLNMAHLQLIDRSIPDGGSFQFANCWFTRG